MSKTHPVRRLHIPVRLAQGIWECALGGPVPAKDGTQAELIVERTSISDRAFLEMMERKGRHKVLDEGTPLLVCLTVKPESPPAGTLGTLLKHYKREMIAPEFLDSWNSGSPLTFIEVKLGGPDEKQTNLFGTDRGGLWLITQGLEAIGLASTTVLLPEPISDRQVTSLNHAYTKLSEIFETWRISHTGNIYKRVLYQERNNRWYPLDVLRNKALEKREKEIAKDIWEEFMAKMKLSMETGKRKNR
jgi:hypothetical protein